MGKPGRPAEDEAAEEAGGPEAREGPGSEGAPAHVEDVESGQEGTAEDDRVPTTGLATRQSVVEYIAAFVASDVRTAELARAVVQDDCRELARAAAVQCAAILVDSELGQAQELAASILTAAMDQAGAAHWQEAQESANRAMASLCVRDIAMSAEIRLAMQAVEKVLRPYESLQAQLEVANRQVFRPPGLVATMASLEWNTWHRELAAQAAAAFSSFNVVQVSIPALAFMPTLKGEALFAEIQDLDRTLARHGSEVDRVDHAVLGGLAWLAEVENSPAYRRARQSAQDIAEVTARPFSWSDMRLHGVVAWQPRDAPQVTGDRPLWRVQLASDATAVISAETRSVVPKDKTNDRLLLLFIRELQVAERNRAQVLADGRAAVERGEMSDEDFAVLRVLGQPGNLATASSQLRGAADRGDIHRDLREGPDPRPDMGVPCARLFEWTGNQWLRKDLTTHEYQQFRENPEELLGLSDLTVVFDAAGKTLRYLRGSVWVPTNNPRGGLARHLSARVSARPWSSGRDIARLLGGPSSANSVFKANSYLAKVLDAASRGLGRCLQHRGEEGNRTFAFEPDRPVFVVADRM